MALFYPHETTIKDAELPLVSHGFVMINLWRLSGAPFSDLVRTGKWDEHGWWCNNHLEK